MRDQNRKRDFRAGATIGGAFRPFQSLDWLLSCYSVRPWLDVVSKGQRLDVSWRVNEA